MQNEIELEQNQMTSLYEDLTQMFEEADNTEVSSRPQKRVLEEDANESWCQVTNRKQRIREIRESTELCITSKEAFPKQFALAKLFMSENISNIAKVKYINPFKINIELNNINAEKLMKCERLIDMGWRFQRPFEVGLSYGVIRNIELELTDAELLEAISGEPEVCNIRRLKRKNVEESEWIDCESVRVGFKGPILPTYICIYDMKVKVEPYVFPVTQCSKCWRYGHTHKMCPSKKSYCPKCAGKHETCDITIYKCINCTGSHRAMHKSCPVYVKEKQIRDLMAEHNCSYRKAMTMYVPPPIPVDTEEYFPPTASSQEDIPLVPSRSSFPPQESRLPTYAQKAAATTSRQEPTPMQIEETATSSKETTKKKKNRKKNKESNLDDIFMTETLSDVDSDSKNQSDSEQTRHSRPKSDLSFNRLLLQLKNIIFQRDISIICKIQKVIQTSIDFAISWIFQNIPDWSFLLKIVNSYG